MLNQRLAMMKRQRDNEELYFNALLTGIAVISVCIMFLSSCCSIPPAKNDTTTTIKERIITVQGYSTTANFATANLLQGKPLYIVHSSRPTDTVFRMRADQNGNITTVIDCPDDTVRVTDTLKVTNTVYVKEPSFFEKIENVFTLLGVFLGLLIFAYIVYQAKQWNIFKK